MSISLRRSPAEKRKERAREEAALRSSKSSGGCWETENVCSGDRLINEHASRVSWWLVAALVVLALILDGVISEHAFTTEHTGSWSNLHASSWIQPTPRALGSLVGIVLVLDVYVNYMMALKKGHLDRYVGQFLLNTVLRVALWLFFLYGLSYGGTIGSMLALVVLVGILGWGFLTSHSCAPLHSWISVLELVFVVFLIVWVSTTGAKLWPTP